MIFFILYLSWGKIYQLCHKIGGINEEKIYF